MTAQKSHNKTLLRTAVTALLLVAVAFASGCAAPRKVVVVDKHGHNHSVKPGYVVYYTKPKRKSCYRHKGHWHCR